MWTPVSRPNALWNDEVSALSGRADRSSLSLKARVTSGAEPLAAARATGAQNLAAADRRHASPKAVTALAHQLARLIGPLHGSGLRLPERASAAPHSHRARVARPGHKPLNSVVRWPRNPHANVEGHGHDHNLSKTQRFRRKLRTMRSKVPGLIREALGSVNASASRWRRADGGAPADLSKNIDAIHIVGI